MMSVVRGGQFQSHRADRGLPAGPPLLCRGASRAVAVVVGGGRRRLPGARATWASLARRCGMACALRFYGMCVARVWLVRGSCMVSHRHWHVFCTNHARIMHHDLCHVSVVRLACIIFCISVSCTSRPSPMSNNARRAHTLAPASRAAGNGTGEDAIAIWVYG